MEHYTQIQQAALPSVGGHPRPVAGGSGAPAGAASLGIYAECYSAPQNTQGNGPSGSVGIDEETGEVFEIRTDGKGRTTHSKKTPEQGRAEAFALKSVVNGLLPKSRISKCMKWRVPDRDIELIRGRETGKAYYHGLQVCSNPWLCPVCGRKIRERRKMELQAAIAAARAMGWQVYLVTLTAPHRLGDDLKTKIDLMEKAARKLTCDRSGVAFRKMIGLEGTIRAWENTYGDNGHHPHFHFLYFLNPKGYHVGPKEVEFGLTRLWQNACVKVGLPCPSDAHGCRVDDRERVAQYVSKGNWGLESEMTKGFIKSSKTKEGRSMADLLRAVLADKSDKQSAAIFIEYAEAFHGKRQLVWSKGLKKRLAVVDLTDEEINQVEADDVPVCLAQFTDDQWRHVYKSRSESVILDLAEKHPEAIPDFLKRLFATGVGGKDGAEHRSTRPPPGDGA